MWTFEASAVSAASPETIWPLYSNVANWNRWDEAIIASDLEGKFEVGSKGAMTIEGNPHPLEFVLHEVEVNHMFRDITQIPGISIEFKHLLEPTPAGTKITHYVTISGPEWKRGAATVGKKLEQGLPHTVASLARLAERELVNS
jgi:hypothetical protein